MQTFLPYRDFEKSARALDYRRLGKQRVEAWQIYQAIKDPSYGWQNHPAVKMWRGYENALLYYGMWICLIWRVRGYKDTLYDKFVSEMLKQAKPFKITYPPWLGKRSFHISHRSNLLRKDKKYYAQEFKGVPNNLPYVWPV